jgi:hypothetical protein
LTAKLGRPVSDDGPKDKLLQVRMDEKTLEELDWCVTELDTTRSKAVRMGISLLKMYLSGQEKK